MSLFIPYCLGDPLTTMNTSHLWTLFRRVNAPSAANTITQKASARQCWQRSPLTSSPSATQPLVFQHQQQQVRFMSKYMSKSARKRQPLTTKRASRGGFYKGKGATKEGRLTSKGKFFVNPLKRLELIIPDLTGFPLKPYIAASVHKLPPEKR